MPAKRIPAIAAKGDLFTSTLTLSSTLGPRPINSPQRMVSRLCCIGTVVTRFVGRKCRRMCASWRWRRWSCWLRGKLNQNKTRYSPTVQCASPDAHCTVGSDKLSRIRLTVRHPHHGLHILQRRVTGHNTAGAEQKATAAPGLIDTAL